MCVATLYLSLNNLYRRYLRPRLGGLGGNSLRPAFRFIGRNRRRPASWHTRIISIDLRLSSDIEQYGHINTGSEAALPLHC